MTESYQKEAEGERGRGAEGNSPLLLRSSAPPPRWRTHGPIALVLLAFIALGLAASVINPLHEATDELRHYRFVQHIVQRQALPVQGAVGCSAQGHHPPLFYTLGALATFWIDTGRDVCYEPPINPFWNYRQWEVSVDNKNLYLHGPDEAFPWYGEALAAHIVRALNVLIGAATVYLTWLTGRAIWPKRPYLALGGAAFVAFNPMFVYMAGAINNDVIAAMSGTAVLLACVRLVNDPQGLSRRWGVILGALYAVALLSKFNLLAVAGVIEAAMLYVAWRRGQWRLWLEANVLLAATTLALAGWWFVRNQMLYGEPTGVRRLTELWGVRDPSESWGVAIFELTPTWTSLWGRFGYGQIPLPAGIYTALRWVIGAGMAGLLAPAALRRVGEWRISGAPLLLLLLNVALFFTVVFNYLLISPAGAMGRFFFPALSSLSLLAFFGLSRWLALFTGEDFRGDGGVSLRRPQGWLAVGAHVGMALLTTVALFGYLQPAYARPATFAADTAVPNPTNVQFDALVNLRGYEIAETAVRAGGPLDVKLYWEVTAPPPGNFLLFVHLIDNETGTMVVQRDTHPGLGNFPSRYWQAGDRFVESIRVWLPQTAYAPATATLSIGLYAPEGYRLGITAPHGGGLGDALTLGEIDIVPAETPGLAQQFPNPQDHNFGDDVRLVGYEYERRAVRPGDALALTLYWQALRAGAADYLVQVTLLDEGGGVRGQTAVRPQQGALSTATMPVGEVVADRHVVPFTADLPPGAYTIHVALLDASTNARQNILAEDGHWINDHLSLAAVRVRP